MPPYSNAFDDMPPFCGAFPVFTNNEKVRLSAKQASASATKPLDEQNNSSSNLPLKSRKVSFSECLVEIHFVIHKKDISASEREQAWYKQKEIRSIRHSVNEIALKLAEHPNYIPDEETAETWCNRGIIESRTKSSRRKRLTHQEQARNAVFFEQSMQLLDGTDDPYQIADSYVEFSSPCQTAAYKVARQDEKDANEIYDEEPTYKQWPPSSVDLFCYLARKLEKGNRHDVHQLRI